MRRYFALLACAGLSVPASAATFFNGHWYEYVQSNATWQQALADAATAAPMAGFTAHLVTITSAAEDNFVTNVLTNNVIWLAGSDEQTEGVWKWMAGPETGQIFFGPGALPGSYANWSAGEPNNLGNEDFLHTNINAGNWNDVQPDYQGSGYVVEWSPISGAVPEPASWAMMIGGFAIVGAAMRRRTTTLAFS